MAKILVVDDDHDFREIVRTILNSQKYEVLTANDGEKGLEVMRREKPDLVIMDIMMSYVLDGLDTRRQMAEDEDLRHIPVIMVTSLTGDQVQSELPSDKPIPPTEWIKKPFAPNRLLEQVKKMLGR